MQLQHYTIPYNNNTKQYHTIPPHLQSLRRHQRGSSPPMISHGHFSTSVPVWGACYTFIWITQGQHLCKPYLWAKQHNRKLPTMCYTNRQIQIKYKNTNYVNPFSGQGNRQEEVSSTICDRSWQSGHKYNTTASYPCQNWNIHKLALEINKNTHLV